MLVMAYSLAVKGTLKGTLVLHLHFDFLSHGNL